jgi:hypothetical protein
MVKATGPKKKKESPKLADKEQSERFKRTTRELGADESGERFDRAVDKIIKGTERKVFSNG